MDRDVQVVLTASREAQALAARAFLEAAGIPTQIRGEAIRNFLGLTIDGMGRIELLVANADVERARALLESAELGEFRLDPDATPDGSP